MKIIRYTLLIGFALIAIFPFYWMITTAFSEHTWIPDPQLIPAFYFGAIRSVLIDHPFARWMLNTAVIASATAVGGLLIASLAAFAFACLRFRYRDLIFYTLLTTMILPKFLLIIPRYFIMHRLGWLNTYWGVFVPGWFAMFGVFLLRQSFLSIPSDMLNAARVDGANLWQIFWLIIMPVAKPILLVLFVLRFFFHWNDFLWPVIVIRTREMQTLTVGISEFYGTYQTEFNKIMAGSLIGLIPVIIIFILFQKYVEKGLKFRLGF